MQLLDPEPVADHPLIGDDVGGPPAAVEQGHLAEGEAGADRGDPLLAVALAVHLDLDADRAAGEHEEQLRLVPLAHDDVAFLEHERPDDRLDQAAFLAAEALEQIDLRHREFRAVAEIQRRPEARPRTIRAPRRRRGTGARHGRARSRRARATSGSRRSSSASEANTSSAALSFHGLGRPHDQLARRGVGLVHALEVDHHVFGTSRRVALIRRNSCSVEPKNNAPCASSTATLWPVLRQELALLQRAQTVRADDVGAVVAADHAADIGAVVEGVELELARDLLAHADAAHAVALRCRSGGE